jgi:hypothetical protein
MDTSKNRLFLATLGLLGVALLAGVYFAWNGYSEHTKSTIALKKARDEVSKLLAGSPLRADGPAMALKVTNVEAAKKDLEELKAHIALLRASIAGPEGAQINGDPKSTNTELSSQIKQSVDELKKLAADRDVRFVSNASDQPDFGFGRYIHSPGSAPKSKYQQVDQQRLIIEFLFKELVDSRPAPTADYKTPLMLLSIAREPIEALTLIPEGKPGAGTLTADGSDMARYETEEFLSTRNFRRKIELEKDGKKLVVPLLDTVSFRIKFVSTTATLRGFVNRLRNSGRPFAITSIEVGQPSPEALKAFVAPVTPITPAAAAPAFDLSGFGDSSAKPKAAAPAKEERKLVVAEAPSEFTVQIDYLVVPPEPKPAAEGEPKK